MISPSLRKLRLRREGEIDETAWSYGFLNVILQSVSFRFLSRNIFQHIHRPTLIQYSA